MKSIIIVSDIRDAVLDISHVLPIYSTIASGTVFSLDCSVQIVQLICNLIIQLHHDFVVQLLHHFIIQLHNHSVRN